MKFARGDFPIAFWRSKGTESFLFDYLAAEIFARRSGWIVMHDDVPSGRRPWVIFCHPFRTFFPSKSWFDRAFFPTRKLIGSGNGFQILDPFFFEEILHGLPSQSAYGISRAIYGDSRFGRYSTQQFFASC